VANQSVAFLSDVTPPGMSEAGSLPLAGYGQGGPNGNGVALWPPIGLIRQLQQQNQAPPAPEECSCEIARLTGAEAAIVEGYRDSPDGALGVCAAVTNRHQACAYTETVTLLVHPAPGPDENIKFYYRSKVKLGTRGRQERPVEIDNPFMFRQLDSDADKTMGANRGKRNLKRGQGVPDGEGGKWKDEGWKEGFEITEPCPTLDPLRILVKLTNSRTTREKIGVALYKQVEAGTSWENVQLEAVVEVRKGRASGDILCEYPIPIRPRGGIWVQFYGAYESPADEEGLEDKIMKALRRLWNPPNGAGNVPFNWLEGKAPKAGVGLIVPTADFPKQAPAAGRGRQLLYKMLGGHCCAVIMNGRPDSWTPYAPKHAFPKGDKPAKVPDQFGTDVLDCRGGKVNAGRGTFTGIGLGVGGVVKITVMSIRDETPWKLARRGNDRWHDDVGSKQKVTLARVLAHELAHLIQGCDGESTVGKKFYDKRTGKLDGLDWTADPYEFQNDEGEYDATIKWENPIAIELGELPRFNHRG
jgi:hypothetical protein